MKKHFSFLLALLVLQQVAAENLYDQLCAFNFNWKKYADRATHEPARLFRTDAEYVQAHLGHVIPILLENPTDHLNVDQLNSRENLIAVLDGYRLEGKFPLNTKRHERIPVFIDEFDTYCAVGYLLRHTGYDEMARQISALDNYAWVKDIHVDGLLEWQQSSGFTLEELKLIQGAYDYYDLDAFVAVNKYEIPQKPGNYTAYFERGAGGKGAGEDEKHIWCKGEGVDGVIHGRWEQNYSEQLPWIVGYFDHGKRTGQWYEYYQGTNKLCRSENWRNDKLNGVRKRFDLNGKIIEEIMFRDGKAVVKTNYDFILNLTYVRKPINDETVYTEIYTSEGRLISSGNETIYNPGNLLWFQNIELTALNSASISARESSFNTTGPSDSQMNSYVPHRLFNYTPLVKYRKQGDWVFYKEFSGETEKENTQDAWINYLKNSYLKNSIQDISDESLRILNTETAFDSVQIHFEDNYITDFYGFGKNLVHYGIKYLDSLEIANAQPRVYFNIFNPEPIKIMKSAGHYNKDGERIGEWEYFSTDGQVYKIENFILPERKTGIVTTK